MRRYTGAEARALLDAVQSSIGDPMTRHDANVALRLAAADLAATVEALEAERDGERGAVVAYLLAEAAEHQRSHDETGRGPAMSRYADMRDALLFVAKRIESGKHRVSP